MSDAEIHAGLFGDASNTKPPVKESNRSGDQLVEKSDDAYKRAIKTLIQSKKEVK